jgi:DNA-binding response OmpR family regulator
VDEVGRCRALGVADVVQKPVDFDAFSAAVRAIVAVAGPG